MGETDAKVIRLYYSLLLHRSDSHLSRSVKAPTPPPESAPAGKVGIGPRLQRGTVATSALATPPTNRALHCSDLNTESVL